MQPKQFKQYRKHLILFITTFITTTIAGAEWMTGKFLFYTDPALSFGEILDGLNFSIPFILILTFHEFGHYFTAMYYRVSATLPYYIPVWFGFLASPSIGTVGAFIRIIDKPRNTRQYFDIGIAGPLAGFVIAIAVIVYGLQTLPPAEYIFEIHPEYERYGLEYEQYVYDELPTVFYLGDNLLFSFLKTYVAEDPSRVPNMYELYHYPWLFAGYLALFFTALNLLPIGQLDGGHILYGLIGAKASRKAFRVIFIVLVCMAGFGVVTPQMDVTELAVAAPLYFAYLYLVFYSVVPNWGKRLLLVIWVFILQFGLSKFYSNPYDSYVYMLFALIIGRVLGVDHPPSDREIDIGWKRKVLGWLTLGIFVLCFTPSPFNMVINENARQQDTGQQDEIMARVKNHYKEDDNASVSPL